MGQSFGSIIYLPIGDRKLNMLILMHNSSVHRCLVGLCLYTNLISQSGCKTCGAVITLRAMGDNDALIVMSAPWPAPPEQRYPSGQQVTLENSSRHMASMHGAGEPPAF